MRTVLWRTRRGIKVLVETSPIQFLTSQFHMADILRIYSGFTVVLVRRMYGQGDEGITSPPRYEG